MHTIRLRGPWQLEPVFRYVRRHDGGFERVERDLPAATRMHVPGDWNTALGNDFLGRVRYVRTFHAPPGLQFDERVWLVVEPQRSLARVVLVEESLGVVTAAGPDGRFDITHRLSPTNKLEIFVDHPAIEEDCTTSGTVELSLPGGLVGEVRLEILEVR
ncbi:MAG: hypothetical protein AB7G28_25060 [Pirellulales bacterium]